jgi:hypothetical protein
MSYPDSVQNYYGWMTNMLGPGVSPLSRTLMNPSGMNTNEILRELWSSWEGDNFLLSEFFLRKLTKRGEYIKNLLPVEEYDVAIRNYGLRAKGDHVTFDVWNFESAVLPDQSRRHPGRRAEDDREQHSRAFRGGGVGFEVPLDWLEHDTTKRHFAMKIEQMNRTIYLTWTFRVLQTIMFEALDIYSRRLQKLLPLTHEDFSLRLDELVSRTFAMNKNGTNFSGIETRVVNQGQTRDVHYDTVLVPPNSVGAMLIERAPLNLYYLRGEEVYNSNKQAKDLAPEGNRTKHYGLNVFESREFPMGNGAPNKDPLANQCMVSQRFLMLPREVADGFRGYRSCFRDIEIPDGDNRIWRRLTLRAALYASGIFVEAGSNDYHLTELGANILKDLCSVENKRAYTSTNTNSNKDKYNSSGIGASAAFNSVTDNLDPTPYGVPMPPVALAYNMYRNAGIGREIVNFFHTMPAEKFSEFVTALHTTDEELQDSGRMRDFSANGDTFASVYEQDASRYLEAETQRFKDDTRYLSHIGARKDTPVPTAEDKRVFRGSRPHDLLDAHGRLDTRTISTGGVYKRPGVSFNADMKIVVQFLVKKIRDRETCSYQRTITRCFPELDVNVSAGDIIFPSLQLQGESQIHVPHVGRKCPTNLKEFAMDPYWEYLQKETNTVQRKNSKTWLETAVRYIKSTNVLEDEELGSPARSDGVAAAAASVFGANDQDFLRKTDRKSRAVIEASHNVEALSYWAAMTLIGRGVRPEAFDTDKIVLQNEKLMKLANAIALMALDDSVCGFVNRMYVKAFLGHMIDSVAEENTFTDELYQNWEQPTPEDQIRAIVAFMQREGISLLQQSERTALQDSLDRQDNSLPGRSKRSRKDEDNQSPAAIKAMLEAQICNHVFFDTLIRCDIPVPISFILFRMHIRVEVSSAIFMVAGPRTGVVVIKDGFLSFTRRQADFALDVGTRFRTATFITNRDNVELVPHAMAKRYLGGAGTRLYDPNVDCAQYQNGALIKDIFVMAVPYAWTPEAVWTDITGRMNPSTYNGAPRGISLHHTQFKTCRLYESKWGFNHDQAHIFSAQAMGGLQHTPTLAIQATQRSHSGDPYAVELTHITHGHDPMGRLCEPIDYQILSGSTAVAGTGFEDFTPRKQLLAH